MKNKLLTVLLILTALFAGLTLGLYLGRNPAGGSVTVSIPAEVQTAPAAAQTQPEPSAQEDALPVDINSANVTDLAQLPGIGEVLARRIVDYRTIHGRFTAVEQLTNVEGIGEGKLEAILEQITIGG